MSAIKSLPDTRESGVSLSAGFEEPASGLDGGDVVVTQPSVCVSLVPLTFVCSLNQLFYLTIGLLIKQQNGTSKAYIYRQYFAAVALLQFSGVCPYCSYYYRERDR